MPIRARFEIRIEATIDTVSGNGNEKERERERQLRSSRSLIALVQPLRGDVGTAVFAGKWRSLGARTNRAIVPSLPG